MKPFAQQTYYELLEVPPTATDEEIRAAHQRLMELYSPDSIAVYALGDPDQVDALRERMNEAMEMLTDADLRVEYDRSIGLTTERLAKATVTAEAADKVGSATRVAEALATAAAALAKAAGAVDAERLEAESRLKAAASVNDNEGEAPRGSGSPGKSEEQMRGQESKRQESSGMDTPVVPSEPVMVGGVTVVEAFRASFTRSLSFVYVPTTPLRGQGRGGDEAPAPAMEAAVSAAAPSVEAPPPAEAAPVEPPVEHAQSAAPTPPDSVKTEAGVAGSPADSAAAPDGSAPVPESATATPGIAAVPAAPEREEATQAPVASAATEVSTPEPATEAPAAAATQAPEASPEPSAPMAVATTTQGESDPNPAPALDASTTALARLPATGASRDAVRPLTSRPIDGPAPTSPTGPGSVKTPTVRKLGEAQVLAQDSAIATAESALAQVAAKVREARPRGMDIPSDAEFNGELLRRVREARGLTLSQLADRTRISVRHLENVEADRYTALPTTVYLRGILMNLARELGLDPLRVSKSYLALFSEKPAKPGR
ncbi:helix-turn-helix domain-containing protein [Corallococcus sp. EGB]|uniref:helix-turn-helix domain-containing protein n=1 Tax=Corallococcus sp. EGB TaxID=1521117 RepID=UPI001CBE5BF8|nr:helix-turn-helix domain-containing protein [Corallococcus sp. EGB]